MALNPRGVTPESVWKPVFTLKHRQPVKSPRKTMLCTHPSRLRTRKFRRSRQRCRDGESLRQDAANRLRKVSNNGSSLRPPVGGRLHMKKNDSEKAFEPGHVMAGRRYMLKPLGVGSAPMKFTIGCQ